MKFAIGFVVGTAVGKPVFRMVRRRINLIDRIEIAILKRAVGILDGVHERIDSDRHQANCKLREAGR